MTRSIGIQISRLSHAQSSTDENRAGAIAPLPEPYDPTADRTDRRLWERECLSVKTSRDQCQKASIFPSFLETNDGKNLATGFSENVSNPLSNAGLLPAVLPWQRYLVQYNLSKNNHC